jgi:transposase
MLPCSV